MGNDSSKVVNDEILQIRDINVGYYHEVCVVKKGKNYFGNFYIDGKKEGDYFHVSNYCGMKNSGHKIYNADFFLNTINIYDLPYYVKFPRNTRFFYGQETVFHFKNLRKLYVLLFPDCNYICKKIIFNVDCSNSRNKNIRMAIDNSRCPVDIEIRIFSSSSDFSFKFYVSDKQKISILSGCPDISVEQRRKIVVDEDFTLEEVKKQQKISDSRIFYLESQKLCENKPSLENLKRINDGLLPEYSPGQYQFKNLVLDRIAIVSVPKPDNTFNPDDSFFEKILKSHRNVMGSHSKNPWSNHNW